MVLEFQGRRPEDAFMSFCWHHRRLTLAILAFVFCGIPAIVGFLIGLAF